MSRSRHPPTVPRRSAQWPWRTPGAVALLCLWIGRAGTDAASPEKGAWTIVCPRTASSLETLAAREARRYVYLRTGELLDIREADRTWPDRFNSIVVARANSPLFAAVPAAVRSRLDRLQPQGFLLTTLDDHRRQTILVAGADDPGTLYAAYRLAEHLGVRFYLHGDVIPDGSVPLNFTGLDEEAAPLFALRGIQPFHDFPEGPDWWNRDDYLAIVSQLPKLRMNFIGLHTYPEGRPNAEPTVWIGLSEDVAGDGRVRFSYPASYQHTRRGNWGYTPKDTSRFLFGAADLFERDDFGPATAAGSGPQPDTAEDCNAVFNRTGEVLRDAFRHAHALGIRTCVGTETPLVVPARVAERLKARGKSTGDPGVIQALYEGIFRRASQACDPDYYWLWTPEDWTWRGAKPEEVQATTNDLFAAIAAAQNIRTPFRLATCGWVLGPQNDRALFDRILSREIALSCINREVGRTPVDPAFARVQGRSKWAIPWLEDDPALTIPQLWAGRMQRDAADALRYGCDGLLGIHWRTRILGPNIAALAQAAWPLDDTRAPSPNPAAPTSGGDPADEHRSGPAADAFPAMDDFYADWAQAQFGREVAPQAAALFAALDGRLPRPADWVNGPGGIKPDPRPWDSIRGDYDFVDRMEAMRSEVRGAGNRERFDYWLNQFRYMRALAEVNCAWARFTNALAPAKAAKDPAARRALARESALPIRVEMVRLVGEIYRCQLATVSNPGELGTIANWEQHLLPDLLETPGRELADFLGDALPPDAQPSRAYRGPARVIVPTVRSSVAPGELMEIKVLILGRDTPAKAAIHWRPMGQGRFRAAPLVHIARGVYRVTLPPPGRGETALEYYIEAIDPAGVPARFPATAPAVNQTIVVEPPDPGAAKKR